MPASALDSLHPASATLGWEPPQFLTASLTLPALSPRSSSLLFVESDLEDGATLLAGVEPGAEVVVLDAGQDAIAQITQVLAGRQNVASLHILSHGSAGELHLGSTILSAATLQPYASALQSWSKSLTADADILLYGCDIGASSGLLDQIAELTGADVAASTNLTGSASLGGDWILEVSTGSIETQVPFQTGAIAAYAHVLDATYHNLAGGNFAQNWSNAGLITTDDNWSNVPSIMGYRGDGLTGAIGTDPQTVLADGSATPVQVIANQNNPAAAFAGGIAEFDGLANPTIALQGSVTADAPQLVIHLNATGQQNLRVSFTARDIDGTTANAVQAIALQYRIGNTGNFINLPDGSVPDATDGPSLNARQARLSVLLPTAVNNQAQVQVRVLTTNAPSFDEWVGIDDIQVTSGTIAANVAPVAVNDAYTIAENTTLNTAPAITVFEMDSDPGNYVGANEFYRYQPYNIGTPFLIQRNPDNGVRIYFSGANPVFGSDFWSFDFGAIGTAPLVAGTTYTGATRYAFQGSTEPGLDVGGNGRGYNTLTGEFTVNQIVYGPGTEIVSFDASFRENGDANSVAQSFQGRVRYRSTGSGSLPGVLANDTDAEGTTLTASLVTNPVNGTVTFNPDGSFSYTPNPGFNGVDSFTYRSNDSLANSAPATVSITITGLNDPPVNTVPATVSTNQDTAIGFTGVNRLSIADPDAGTASVRTTLSLPANRGILTIAPQTGLTIANNSSAIIQLDGPIAAINAGLATLIYTPAAGLNSTIAGGPIPLTIVTTDLGNTGTGGTLSDSDTVNIAIVPTPLIPPTTPPVTPPIVPPVTPPITPPLPTSPTPHLPISPTPGLFHLGDFGRTNGVYQVGGTTRQAVSLQFDWISRHADFDNEIGFFQVEDDFGRVGGLTPGEAGYAQAAIARHQVLFASGQQAGAGVDRVLNEGDRLVFYIVQNDTTIHWLATNPQNSLASSAIFFSVLGSNCDRFDHARRQTLNPGSVRLAWEDLTDGGDCDFNDVVFTVGAAAVALSSAGGVSLTVRSTTPKFSSNRELGLFFSDDSSGRIGTLFPGDRGYTAAALRPDNSRVVFSNGQTSATTQLALPTGRFLNWYWIEAGTTEQFLAQNPTNQTGERPIAFFSFSAANDDRADHFQRFSGDEFGFVDQFNANGDGFGEFRFQIQTR